MAETAGVVVSVQVGAAGVLEKEASESIEFALDGIIGDRHRGPSRETWDKGDKQPAGTLRRNERMWSAISSEELANIQVNLDLDAPLAAADIGVNFCVQGIADFSRLPRGALLQFSSGALLMVEEYNPPCLDMGLRLTERFKTKSGEPLDPNAFSNAAKFSRGLVGIVEVPGTLAPGDTVTVIREVLPKWLR